MVLEYAVVLLPLYSVRFHLQLNMSIEVNVPEHNVGHPLSGVRWNVRGGERDFAAQGRVSVTRG